MFIFSGCSSSGSQQSSGDDNIDIEKIYYTALNEDEYKVYVTYKVYAKEDEDIVVGESPILDYGYGSVGGGLYSADPNKDFIQLLGFPTTVKYENIRAGSENGIEYINYFVINKKSIDENVTLTLQVPNSSTALGKNFEKSFSVSDVDSFEYKDDSEFHDELVKDHSN